MIVNSHLFEAFLECSTKCWLRSRAVPTVGNAYADWARAQSEAYYGDALKRLLARHSGDIVGKPPGTTWRGRALLQYNRQDCEALQIVANRLVDLHCEAPASDRWPRSEVVRTSDMKRGSPYGFKRKEFVFPVLEAINKAAYWNYQRERVYVKSRNKTNFRSARKTKRGFPLKPNTSIEYPRPFSWPAAQLPSARV
jgi:hypothetical protein